MHVCSPNLFNFDLARKYLNDHWKWQKNAARNKTLFKTYFSSFYETQNFAYEVA